MPVRRTGWLSGSPTLSVSWPDLAPPGPARPGPGRAGLVLPPRARFGLTPSRAQFYVVPDGYPFHVAPAARFRLTPSRLRSLPSVHYS